MRLERTFSPRRPPVKERLVTRHDRDGALPGTREGKESHRRFFRLISLNLFYYLYNIYNLPFHLADIRDPTSALALHHIAFHKTAAAPTAVPPCSSSSSSSDSPSWPRVCV